MRKFIDQFVYNNKILYERAMEIIKMKELIEKKNNLLNISINTNYNDNFKHNLKVLPKDNIEDDSSLKEDKITKKEEIKEKHKINNEDTKNNTDNDKIDKDNNNSNNYSNKEIEIKNKIEELKLKLNLISKDSTDSNNTNNTNGAFPDNGFNTTKNSNKLSNNINFIDKDMRENNSNVYNTNNDTNISSNKVGGIKINSQKQNKKNIFRFKAQEQQQPNKIGLNNIIYSNKFDPSLPLTLLLSNISKGILTPKASSQDKNNKDKNKMKKNVDKNINNIKPVLLRDLPSDVSNMNKKTKYINLLEKFKGYNNKINNISIHNHKKMKNNYSMKNMNVAKPYNLRVSSSISSYHGYNIGGANTFKEKNGTTFNRVTKSKSTDNFMLYNNKFPKTPKEQYKQRIVMNNKNIINFFDGINYTKSTKNNNGIYSKQNYGGTHKMKKNKMNKK